MPVPISHSRRPGFTASSTSVPVGFLPRKIWSPGSIFCSFEVSGPSATLMEKNSSSSAKPGLATE